MLFIDYWCEYDLDIKVTRIFNTYGPRMLSDDGRVVSNCIVQALKGEDITIYGEDQRTRSFCCVDDLIGAFVRLMNTPAEFTGPVNLDIPAEYTIRQLAAEDFSLEEMGDRPVILHDNIPSTPGKMWIDPISND